MNTNRDKSSMAESLSASNGHFSQTSALIVENAGDRLLDYYLTLSEDQRKQEFLNTEDAATFAGVSRRTIQYWAEIGAIEAVFIIATIVLVLIASSVMYLRLAHSTAKLNGAAKPVLPSIQEQIPAPPPPPRPPPPPPRPGNELATSPSPEPMRTLVGMTNEQLKEVERHLPEGSEIATYPVGSNELKAALISADLDGDDIAETIVAYKEPKPAGSGEPSLLTLAVFAGRDKDLTLLASTQLPGNYIYTNTYDHLACPFAVRDVTGGGRGKIIVTSAQGLSLGATLQVFSLDGSSLREIANVSGHYLHVLNGGPRRPRAPVKYSQIKGLATT